METQNFQYINPSTAAPESTKADICKDPTSAVEIQAWIVSYLAELLEIEPDEVNPTIPFDRYGLDSSAAVGLTGDLEDWMEKKLDPTLLYDYPTVEALSRHLAEEFQVKV
ncbi:MAG: acyl carrier protein [Tolypothrix sp. T3-bin4]|nr:acyl carrier protein [Tolypothrix sp. Co-bin9]MBD0303434.1 acyl carrier protein [Tolypothrix sp. T3-bin4]